MIFLGKGRNRLVVSRHNDSKYVYKIPLNIDGINNNYREANLWKRRSEYYPFQYARCKLVPGTTILVMERVDIKQIDWKNLPDWAYLIDCVQVGINSVGKLVAYDYAE